MRISLSQEEIGFITNELNQLQLVKNA
jgi:hypothetical protein